VVAEGAPHELKAATGEAQLEVTLTQGSPQAAAVLEPLVAGAVHTSDDGRLLRAPVRGAAGLATQIVRALDAAGVTVDDIAVHQPSLDDVFLALTGHPAELADDGDPGAAVDPESDLDPDDSTLEEVA
jgi:hypothetical protein